VIKLILRYGLFPLIWMVLSAVLKWVFWTFPYMVWDGFSCSYECDNCSATVPCGMLSVVISITGAIVFACGILGGLYWDNDDFDLTFSGVNWWWPTTLVVAGSYLIIPGLVRLIVFLCWTSVPGPVREPEHHCCGCKECQ
jgi:hypothetical protein